MKFKVQVAVESESGEVQLIQKVSQIGRVNLKPDNLGLIIAEAKEILHRSQRHIAFQQVAEYQKQQEFCPIATRSWVLQPVAVKTYKMAPFGLILRCKKRLFD